MSTTSAKLHRRSGHAGPNPQPLTGSAIVALFGTMLLLAVVPGPADFAVVARSIASGFNHGLFMVGGIIAADLLFIVIAVYSLSVVAGSMGTLFVVVKYLCGAYLIWLGTGLLRPRPVLARVRGTMESSLFSSFLGGLLMTLGDPKAILFYIGLFPGISRPVRRVIGRHHHNHADCDHSGRWSQAHLRVHGGQSEAFP